MPADSVDPGSAPGVDRQPSVPERLVLSGTEVVVASPPRAEVTYTMQDGAMLTLPAVTRTRVRDGRACEYQIFMDPGPVVAASR